MWGKWEIPLSVTNGSYSKKLVTDIPVTNYFKPNLSVTDSGIFRFSACSFLTDSLHVNENVLYAGIKTTIMKQLGLKRLD